jgi:DNA-binding PadR family transcriptional regulator
MGPRRTFVRPGASLPTAAFYVLLSLSSDDRDSKEILEDLTLSSAGRVRISSATLTSNLKRLHEAGLIAQVDTRVYRLTHDGRRELAHELERMEHALKVARSRRPES